MTRDSSITGGGGGEGGGGDDWGAEAAGLSVGRDWLLGVESHVPLESLQKSNCKEILSQTQQPYNLATRSSNTD